MTDLDRREIIVVTGGRDRTPTLAELERLVELLTDLGARVIRHGDCRPRRNERGELVGSSDTHVAGYLRARGWAVEPWPADWTTHGRAAGPIRNRDMISGRRPGQLVPEPPANAVVAFAGGSGTLDCRVAGYEAVLVVHHVWPVEEPRIWNSHHGKPPGPALYCGRPGPVGNPERVAAGLGSARAEVAAQAIGEYKRWLWARIDPKSPSFDQRVVDYILELTPQHYAVCSCSPAHCHVEAVIAAWRWLRRDQE